MIPSSNIASRWSAARNLPERIGATRAFLRDLLERDVHEVEAIIYEGKQTSYTDVYGRSLFSADLIQVLWYSVKKLLTSRRTSRREWWSRELEGQVRMEYGEWENYFVGRAAGEATRLAAELERYSWKQGREGRYGHS